MHSPVSGLIVRRALIQCHVRSFGCAQWLKCIVPNGIIEIGQHWLTLWLRATLVKYGFPYSMAIIQAHRPAKLHTAVLETHSPVDGTQPGNVASNCKIKVLLKVTISLSAWTTLMHSNKICYGKFGHSMPVAICICDICVEVDFHVWWGFSFDLISFQSCVTGVTYLHQFTSMLAAVMILIKNRLCIWQRYRLLSIWCIALIYWWHISMS